MSDAMFNDSPFEIDDPAGSSLRITTTEEVFFQLTATWVWAQDDKDALHRPHPGEEAASCPASALVWSVDRQALVAPERLGTMRIRKARGGTLLVSVDGDGLIGVARAGGAKQADPAGKGATLMVKVEPLQQPGAPTLVVPLMGVL